MQASKSKLAREKDLLRQELNDMDEKLIEANNRVHNEKQVRRDDIQRMIDETQAKEIETQEYIDGLDEMNYELAAEVEQAVEDRREASRLRDRWKYHAKQRYTKWQSEKTTNDTLKDELVRLQKELEQTKKILTKYKAMAESSPECMRRMKKEWEDEDAASKRGGGRKWPVWVVILICELLVNGTSPRAIPGNIESFYFALYGTTPDVTPSVNFCRECRPIVQVIGETITALKLGIADAWDQLWADATTRRQTPFTALIIGMMGEDYEIDPVIVSSCIFMEDERSETQADCLIDKVRE